MRLLPLPLPKPDRREKSLVQKSEDLVQFKSGPPLIGYVTSGRSFTSPPYASISLSLRKGGGQDQLHHLTKGLTPTVLCLFTTLCSVVAEQRPCINCPISHIEAELGV